ncbi:MAG: dihydrofolate reductase family protein [Solirubrobacterales bacterium]|nr:dihydrofolate reductase family protein [Solirubrobacterales bacterium]
MGKIVVTEFTSLDGVMEAPGGEDFKYENWSFQFDRGDDGDKFKLDEALQAEALLLGRRTYESFAGAWPDREGPFADKLNEMPKYVVSSTMDEAEWNNTTVLPAKDVVAEVTELKGSIDGEIQLPGSNQLVHELFAAGLVDQVNLMVFPVVLGLPDAKRVFGSMDDMVKLKLTESRTVGSDGTQVMIYEVPSG